MLLLFRWILFRILLLLLKLNIIYGRCRFQMPFILLLLLLLWMPIAFVLLFPVHTTIQLVSTFVSKHSFYWLLTNSSLRAGTTSWNGNSSDILLFRDIKKTIIIIISTNVNNVFVFYKGDTMCSTVWHVKDEILTISSNTM